MNKINLTLTSDGDKDGSLVHLNAVFENRQAAIDFHAQVAALCRQAARASGSTVDTTAGGFMRLLAR